MPIHIRKRTHTHTDRHSNISIHIEQLEDCHCAGTPNVENRRDVAHAARWGQCQVTSHAPALANFIAFLSNHSKKAVIESVQTNGTFCMLAVQNPITLSTNSVAVRKFVI